MRNLLTLLLFMGLVSTTYGTLPHEQRLIDAARKIRSSDAYLQKEYERKLRWERVRQNAYYYQLRQQHVIYLPVYISSGKRY
jgi:hypothetical protein